jgi:hypothetical protein
VQSLLFQLQTVDVEVTNPFESDGEFAISLIQVVDAFYLPFNQGTVKLAAGQSSKITLSFLPLELLNYSAQIGFIDHKLGEFYYELSGTTGNPPVDQTQGDHHAIKMDSMGRCGRFGLCDHRANWSPKQPPPKSRINPWLHPNPLPHCSGPWSVWF